MVWSARRKLGIALLILLAVASWVGWQFVERAVLVESASHFLLPAVAIVLMVGCLFFGAIVWQEPSFRWLAASFLGFPSLLAAFSWSHIGVIVLALALTYVGLQRIQGELSERLHLSVRKSLLIGTTPLLLAVSLLISSQYYTHAQSLTWEKLVPSFSLGEGAGAWFLKGLSPFFPELRQLGDSQATVDSFLGEVHARQQSSIDALPPGVQSVFLESELTRAKGQLKELLGREVSGNESMQSIVSEALQRKLITLVSGGAEQLPVPLLPLVLSLLLFLTIYPLLAFAAPALVVLVSLLVRLARRLSWIMVKSERVEHEVIAE